MRTRTIFRIVDATAHTREVTNMSKHYFSETYGSKPPENYERFFVPAIGEPLAQDLIRSAALRPHERVLDVACGTGIVARLAAQQIDSNGVIAGVDITPGMLAVARSSTPANLPIEWHEANAEDMPLPDDAFDVALCQLGLQFMTDKLAALKEMRRVLLPGGRLILTLPGPAGKLFAVLAEAMGRHIGAETAGFVNHVFSLHDTAKIQQLMNDAGFRDITFRVNDKMLSLPPSKDFLWQYIYSTPLAGMVMQTNEEKLAALEHEIVELWREFEKDGGLRYQQSMVEVSARK
jgi:ubiquinone/menaquinone biosynthesis C-methylase UbiE